VLIGAGIGVTPFASILQSIVARHERMKLEKVHFFWLYRGQKTYEWFSEMLGQIDASHAGAGANPGVTDVITAS
jgi:predicted ferric reductase